MKLYNNKSQFVDLSDEVRELLLLPYRRHGYSESFGITYVHMRNSGSHV